MSNDRDDRTEDALRRALHAQAQGVAPSGDGLTRIQRRVAARDARMRWLRPALAGSVAVAVIAAGVGGYAIARHGNDGDAKVQITHSTTPTPNDVSVDGYPADAIFPFTTSADERTWEKSFAQGNSPWISDPTAVTESWIKYYLKEKGSFGFSAATTGGVSDVTVSRSIGGTDHAVTVVHLVKFDNAWLVTGASDPAGDLSFVSPTANSSVSSPLTVTGPGYGVDERAVVEVRDATTSKLYGTANTGPFGNGTSQWSATVRFTATSDAGVVVATVASAADGEVGTLAAEKVTFGAAAHAVEAQEFYGVSAGHLVRFDATTGAAIGDVSGADAEGTVAEVQEAGTALYFTAGPAGCAADLYEMPAAGGSPTRMATADAGYGITGFAISADAVKLAYFESGCGSQAGRGRLGFQPVGGGAVRSISFPSLPPVIVGDPVWEADGVHVDAFVRTGMLGYLARYDAGSGDNPQPSTDACPGFNVEAGLPNAVAAGPGGALWVASQTGTSMQVVSCTGTKPTTVFTVPGNDTPQSLSISASGEALLVGTTGKVWKWTGTGNATELPDATGVSSATW